MQTGAELHKGRFTAAGGAHESDELAFVNTQVDVFNGITRRIVGQANIIKGDERCRHAYSPSAGNSMRSSWAGK